MKKEFNNTAYELVRDYISENGGCSKEIYDVQAGIEYKKAMEELKSFDGQKVELYFTSEIDWIKGAGKKIGKVKIVDDRIRFYEGRKTTRFFYLDAGMFEGWFATLIPKKVLSL